MTEPNAANEDMAAKDEGSPGGQAVGQDCGCASGADDSAEACCLPGKGGRSWIRTVIFGAVMLIAAGVAAHSLANRSDSNGNLSPCAAKKAARAAGAVCPADKAAGCSGAVCPTDKAAACDGSGYAGKKAGGCGKASCGGAACAALAGLTEKVGQQQAIFVVLSAADSPAAQASPADVDAAVKALAGQGRAAAAVTLAKGDKGYDELVKRFAVQSFPAVIVTGRKCKNAAVVTEISEQTLLAGFVKATV